MDKIYVGVFKDSRGELGFDVSRYDNKTEAQGYLDESGLEIIDLIEIDTFHPTMSGCPEAVILGLASTPEGVNVLGLLLKSVADYQKKHLNL